MAGNAKRTDFDGRVVVVTGAGSGIGRSAAELFASRGATVVVSDVVDDQGREVVKLLEKAGAKAKYVHADVSKPADCRALVDATIEAYGRLDVAVNNAGVGGGSALVADYEIDEWNRVIGINLSGVFYGMKYQIPAMLRTGGGSIVNISSILGQVAFATACAYVSAKHGVVGLTKTAAVEYGAQGIRVNAVGPGFIHTPMVERLEADEATNEMLIAAHPIGRLGDPEEVAALIVFLSSDEASFISGGYHPVDGAYLAR